MPTSVYNSSAWLFTTRQSFNMLFARVKHSNRALLSVTHVPLPTAKLGAVTLHHQKRSKSCCSKGTTGVTEKVYNRGLFERRFWTHKLTWQRTRVNTLRCLIGCTAGDFGTMWYLQFNYPEISPWASTAAAMIAGISSSLALETVLLKRTMSIPYSKAFKTAMGMSFVSMLTMELAENLMDWHLMGGQVAFHDPHFWLAAAASAAAGYVVPLPYNYWRLRALGKSCH